MSGTVTTFSTPDYVVFAGTLVISAAIGIYYACSGGKQKTVDEFLMADRNMSWFPVAASLLASFMSAITILGTPGEVYSFGTIYCWSVVSTIFAMWISSEVYLPVFYRLKITSIYEYIDRRFNKAVRLTAMALFIMQMGGMKAVLWTDTFQIFIMYAGVIAVIIRGCMNLGGGAVVWEHARVSGRLDFYNVSKLFAADPRHRHTFWTQIVGGTFTAVAVYGVNQAQIQRALTLSKLKKAKLAYWVNLPGLSAFALLGAFCGLIIYSHYRLCDPLKAGIVASKDQLYPLFVMETLGVYQGLPGLILASVFSGALSTVSSGLNSLAAVTLQDVVKLARPNLTEKQAAVISKILAVVYGIIAILLAFIAKFLGAGMLTTALALFNIIGGPMLGLFSAGMFFPSVNSYGALVGIAAGMGINLWIGMGQLVNWAYIYKMPTSVAGCNVTLIANLTLDAIGNASVEPYDPYPHFRSGVDALYDISYMWLGPIGYCAVVIVALLVSLGTGNNKSSPVDPQLLTPVFSSLFSCFPWSWRRTLTFCVSEAEFKTAEDKPGFDHEVETEMTRDPKMSAEVVYDGEPQNSKTNDGLHNGTVNEGYSSEDYNREL